jgi:hypothetical protein
MTRHATAFNILTLLALLFAADAGAQASRDTIKTDSIRNKYLPTGVRIGTDLISIVKTRTQDNFTGWEVNGEIDFSRYYFVLEYGKWGRDLNSDSAAYSNLGRYWRAGVDVNFLTKDPDRNVFSLGLRYGRSRFSEWMNVSRYDAIWGHLNDSFFHSDVNASWLELTTGLRVKIWKIFWIGYTGRLKFALNAGVTREMLPYDVPGFGTADKETTWGFNYYLLIRLPIRKAPPLPSVDK